MHISEFDYVLPENLIAQKPANPRDSSKLLIVNTQKNSLQDDVFRNITNYLRPGDVLVFNNSFVFPARLLGKTTQGKEIEVLLLTQISPSKWKCILSPGVKNMHQIIFSSNLNARVENTSYEEKQRVLSFNLSHEKLWSAIYREGKMPTPPYIKPSEKDADHYQTIFAQKEKRGSAAAPTAGLHFTKEIFEALTQKNIETAFCTLHVGLGTFEPVHEENILDHTIHSERYEIDQKNYLKIKKARASGKRIIAVGTTSARVLETLFSSKKQSLSGETNIFIYPGYAFTAINGLITNFHLPKSSLLMLVSALAGTQRIKKAYAHAIKNNYRFYSYGDAMLITN